MTLTSPITGQNALADRIKRLRYVKEGIRAVRSYSLLRSLMSASTKVVTVFESASVHAHGSVAAAVGNVLSIMSGAPLETTTRVLADERRHAQTLKAQVVERTLPGTQAIAIPSCRRTYLAHSLGIRMVVVDLVPNGANAEAFFVLSSARRAAVHYMLSVA